MKLEVEEVEVTDAMILEAVRPMVTPSIRVEVAEEIADLIAEMKAKGKVVVAFSGPKESGKDTAGRMFFDAYNNHSQGRMSRRLAFASPVKAITHLMFDVGHDIIEDPTLKEMPRPETFGLPPRKVLQDIANYMRMAYSPRIWVVNWLRQALKTEAEVVIITDLRFPEEIQMVQAVDGWLCYIKRPKAEAKLAEQVAQRNALATNVSESHWDTVRQAANFIFDNDGSLENLNLQVQALVSTCHAQVRSFQNSNRNR